MRAFLKYTLFVFLILLFSAILIEIGLGIAFRIKDRNVQAMNVKDFPYIYFSFEKDEFSNADGIKTTKSITKEPGKFRIVLIGGSVARGSGNTETIANFLEKELNDALATDKIEVINAGMSAFVAEQEFIFTQLVLQKYEPDMVIGLDGYNDLLTWRINRFTTESPFMLPPHNYAQFRVIRDGKYQKSFISRFTGFYKNIGRVVHYYERKSLEKKFNWDSIGLPEKADVSATYWSVIQDTRDFCTAKKIDYYSFLQPIRFYGDRSDTSKLTKEQRGMSSIYMLMELETLEKGYSHSLAKLFKARKEVFMDDCHVNVEGNQIIAKEMAKFLQPKLEDYLTPAGVPDLQGIPDDVAFPEGI
ncbi:MAG: SGNH/GDSL hydrolase family protein [Chitinophagales bacterium]|nr:SGNH/GDSL hydrolase family protein [Chitinophagales bacterium]